MKIRIQATILALPAKMLLAQVLLATAGCQLFVDLEGYRFELPDADEEISTLEPPVSDPLGDSPDAGAPDDPDDPSGSDSDTPTGSEPPSDPDVPLDPGSGSGTDPGSDPGSEPDPSDDPEPPPEEDPEPEPVPEPPPPDPTYGCSIIEYCYAHQVEDTTDEERCIQLGCSLDDAIAECGAEIANVCGTAPRPPFVIITLDGERVVF